MRPTEIQPLDKKRTAGCAGGDRFTEALVWVAFLLIAAMAAIGVEIWYHPSGRVSAEVAVAPTASPLAEATSTPAHTATRVPTTAAAAAVSPTPVTP
jgi:hypothetical protein